MSQAIEHGARYVGRKDVLVLDAQSHASLRVLAGRVWVTDGRGRDIVLGIGERLLLPEHAGRVVISGLEGSAWVDVEAKASVLAA
jgi:hypothetical protein